MTLSYHIYLMQIWGKFVFKFFCRRKCLESVRVNSSIFFSLSTLDDVLLSYITSVLEDLGSQASTEENFDVEMFVEMLEAYIPGFSKIDTYEQFYYLQTN